MIYDKTTRCAESICKALGSLFMGVGTLMIGCGTLTGIPNSFKEVAKSSTEFLKAAQDYLKATQIERNTQIKKEDLRIQKLFTDSFYAKEIIKQDKKNISSSEMNRALATLKAYAPEISLYQPEAGKILSEIQKEAHDLVDKSPDARLKTNKTIQSLSNQFDKIAEEKIFYAK